jgi:hypothetical protein
MPSVIVIYHNHQEFITCDAADEARVKAEFFKTRDPARFKRLAVGDFVYARVTAPSKGISTEGVTLYGQPSLLLTTNLWSDKL